MTKGHVICYDGHSGDQHARYGYLAGNVGLVNLGMRTPQWYAFRQPDGAALNDPIKGDPTRTQALKTAKKALRQIRRLTKVEGCA